MVASLSATQDEQNAPREPIAIIGIGCRFPGGIHDPRSFWRALLDGVDAITEIPPSRFDLGRFYDARPATPGKVMTRWGGFLDDVDRFDAYFFGISPREADRLDPQQRLLLEVAWEALEDAGQRPQPHSEHLRETGVFAGVWLSDYEARLFHNPEDADFYMTTGSGRYSIAGRLSYQFGFQGPSLTVDTACSSSLVAVHLACQSLYNGECDLALAGGVNVILQPQITIAYSQSKMMAPDGRCKFGDARGDGYVRSEGAGMIVLKRLSAALADGDPIYAVIRGSAVNNDGRSSGFLATPGTAGQEDLLRKAYRDAGVPPGQVQYIEAHGTGTRAGDPVEIEALGNVLAEGRPAAQLCAVGSVKTNLGHTEGAAGIAGLIKVALSLQHRTLPASLHFQTPNPAVPWERIPMRVQAQQTPWPAHEGPAIGGVSAFGIAGTNAHIVLAEAPAAAGGDTGDPAAEERAEERAYLLPLSAHTPEALAALVAQFRAFVNAPDAPALADLCYTAAVRRTHHSQRAAFAGSSLEELAAQLEAYQDGASAAASTAGTPAARKIAFIFSGQGSQWLGMGRDLLRVSPVFRSAIEACDRALRAHVDWSLLEQLGATQEQSRLEEISVIQPTLFAVQVALAAVWRAWGIEPGAVIGHSMGEVAAAYVAGALSLEAAAQVICVRSRLMQEISGQGAMLVVDLPLEAAQAAAAAHLGVSAAVSNSRRSTVLSGDPPALEALEAQFKAQEIFCRFVKVDVAAHSPQMDPLRPRLEAALSSLHPRAAAVPVISTVTGAAIDGGALDAAYWGRNLRQPVLFAAAVEAALADGCNTFIEISPHPVLTTAVEQGFAFASGAGEPLAALASCRRNEDESSSLLRSLGDLYTLGYPVDWARLYPEGGRPVPLPPYPWQREHFWYDNIPGFGADGGSARRERQHPLLGSEVPLAAPAGRRVWENNLNARELPLLFQHRVHSTLLLPASALLGALVAAGEQALGSRRLLLADIQFHRPLLLQEETATQVQTVLTPQGGGFELQLYSRPASASAADAGDWTLHAACRLGALPADAAPDPAPAKEEIARRLTAALRGADYYAELAAAGIAFGDLRPVQEARRGPDEALAELASGESQEAAPPTWLDGLFQLTPLAVPQSHGSTANGANGAANGRANGTGDGGSTIYTPARLAELRVYAPGDHAAAWGYVRLEGEKAGGIVQNLLVADAGGALLAEARGLELAALGETAHARAEDWLYTLTWQPQPRPAAVNAAPAGDWIIFADRRGDPNSVGAALAAAIRAAGGAAALVYAGKGPAQVGAHEYTIDPISADDMDALWRQLFPTGESQRRGIVHLWGLDSEQPAAAGVAALSAQAVLAAEQRSLGSALRIAQAAAARQWAAAPKLWIVTQGAQRPPAQDGDPSRSDAALLQAPLWGLGRVLRVEHPDIWGGLIDLAAALSPGAAADILWAELAAASSAGDVDDGAPDQEVALDGEGRYIPRLAPARAAHAPLSAWRPRPDAAYLITGGLGGLGLLLAQWMVEQGARRLILMGRTPLPPRKEWASIDSHSGSGQKIAAVRRLEAQGASVHLAAVDVGDETQLRAFLADYAAEGWPPIRGVVHAAGTVRDRLAANLTWAEIAEVLHAKVQGGCQLAELLPDLDFFVSFSSVGAVLGQPGQGNYAAANAFLDALARRQRSRGQAALSINWGPWAGVGFAALAGGQHVTEQLAQQGIAALTPEDGLAVLRRLLGMISAPDALAGESEGEAEVLVLPLVEPAVGAQVRSPLLGALHAVRRQGVQSPPADSAPAAPGGGESAATALDTLRALEPAQRRAKLAAYVQGAVAQVLRMPLARVGLSAPLGSLGLDSLMALELRNRLESTFAITLPATFAWNYPTIQELTPYLAGRMNLALGGAGAQAAPLQASSPAPAQDGQTGAPAKSPGTPDDELGGLDQLLAGIDALSDESALDLLKAQRR